MRIVITSDTHGKHDALAELSGDVLIHCGDFCDGFHPNPVDIQRIDDWFGRQSFRHVLCVGGNHDFVAQDRTQVESVLFQNATYLQDSSVTIDGIRFYGAPWVPTLQRWAYYLSDDELREKWELIPDDTDVLITHTPPWYILDSPRDASVHCGCSHLAARIATLNLRLHCFGHNHSSYGRVVREGVTYLNASAVDSDFEIANPPFVIDIESDSPMEH
ncbi:metallophosphatase domain-containing protein [Mariniblastus sp.]|nr:metallophosphatase domain-containing protein [Mariniblastus sp.]